MKKVFISQPMRNLTKEEILDSRNKAIQYVEEKYGDVVILDSFFEEYEECKAENKALAYLGRSISILANADVAVFCEGWESARGCKIENQCAIEYGIEVVEMYSK